MDLITVRDRPQTTMRFNALVVVSLCALSAVADKVHDVFDAHRDEILSVGVSAIDGNVYLVGKAQSPRSRGDAVGWTKAEENAKWHLGDQHRAMAPWAEDVTETEKNLAWSEYRAANPNRFHAVGMQRIWTQKTPPDRYLVVLSVPAEFVKLSPPTAQELAEMVGRVRKKRRLTEEAARRAAEEAARKAAEEEAVRKAEAEAAERKAGARKVLDGGVIRQQQLDEDMML